MASGRCAIQRLDGRTFLCKFLTFSNGVNGCILLTFGSIYTNLRDFVKHGLHFMTIWPGGGT